MKTFKLFFASLIFSLLSLQANCQLSLGANASYLNLIGNFNLSSYGLGIKADYAVDDENIVTGGFNYYLPITFNDQITGLSYSSAVNPFQIDIDAAYNISFYNLYLGGKRYFVGDTYYDFGIYVLGEIGMVIAPYTVELGEYDRDLYSTEYDDSNSDFLANFTLNLGLGGEYDFNFAFLFADVKFNIPSNLNAAGDVIAVEIPYSFSIFTGLRFPLD